MLADLARLVVQLLCAVKQNHENGVCHGDIKCENVLVTSWNWLYLSDFASFKPTYIPIDDPSDFSFFFHTGGRRRCYLAPERFYEQGGETQVAPDAPLKPSMDIFSLGCVIAELFLEGQPLFEYSQLLAYRRGQYDPCQLLEKIPDIGIRKMILHMIQLNPELRLSCESYLQEYGSFVFPSYFSPFLHKFFSCLIPMDSDTRVAVTQSAFHEIHRQMMGGRLFNEIAPKCASASGVTSCEPGRQMMTSKKESMNTLNSYSQNSKMGMEVVNDLLVGKVSNLLKDVEQGKDHLNVNRMLQDVPYEPKNVDVSQNMEHSGQKPRSEVVQVQAISKEYREKEFPLLRKVEKSDLQVLLSEYNSQLDAYTYALFPETRSTFSCEGMVLIASLLCSCIRSVKQPQLKRGAVLLLLHSSLYIDDEDRLQHVLPYVIAMLSDSSAIVRCAALETLSDILPLVRDFPPSDAKIFPEYILPMVSMLPHDQEESVRICYASNIFKIALTAYRLLIYSQGLSEPRSLDKLNLPPRSPSHSDATLKKHRDSTDAQISQLRKSIAEVVQELVMGPKQTPSIRRALLKDIGHLCYFFGQRQSNDFLLPILPAFLNDRNEQLRAVFYGQIVFVCVFVGQRSVEEYLLPYIEQGLSDRMEAVLVNALQCLTLLCKSGFLRKKILLDMIGKALPLLRYPIQWVRRSAVGFIAASSESLGPVDSYVYLSPVLRQFLHREPTSLYLESSLFSFLKPPVSKLIFYQVLESARSSDMLERQRKIWYNSSASSKQWENIEITGKLAKDQASRKKESSMQDNKDKKYSDIATKLITLDLGDIPKSRVTGASRNFSSTMDNRDSLSPEKLQFSGFVSPHVSAGNSVLCDGPSEGIPVYSFSTVRRGTVSVANSDTSLQWNSSGAGSLSSVWMDPAKKSFGLSSSVPPKLVSGSFLNISNGSKQVVKLLQEPEERENDQSAPIISKFQDISVSDALKGSSSMAGEDIPTQFDATGFRASPVSDSGWRPRGVLVAHLQEHRSAVNDIAASNDQSFFVTASDDFTVKIWDTRKLEKDISFRSRLTYPLDGQRALCTTMLRGSSQVVVGSSSGTIHIFSVDYVSRGLGSVVERYSGIADIKKKDDGEGAVLSLLNCSTDTSLTQTVLYSTQHYGIHLWDTRTGSTTWTFKTPPDEGYISSLVMGSCGNWFVSGSSRGVLTLWDLRFRLPVYSWQYSTECPIEDMCLFIPPANTTISASGRPLVYVAAGCDEVSLWNAENGSCHQVLRLAGGEGDAEPSSNVLWALRKSSSKSGLKQDRERNGDLKYKTDELNQPPARLPGVRSVLPLPGGDLLTGGTDLKIRYWDNLSPSRSYCICGPSAKGIGCDEQYDTRSCFGVQVVQETSRRPVALKLTQKALLAVAATDCAGCHRDSVLSMATVKLNQRLLISGSRDGAIKVWK
ncbi:hypothetical protein Taro_023949 [Colocasia esculenta]|uniref:non-specific serine/threonine protein kinase n=1 Tax=Colocasia esculenta TaxID=4460 RepID=A0A843VCC0_COLES|nr:hypothetical protein [Colocasia esculenta]